MRKLFLISVITLTACSTLDPLEGQTSVVEEACLEGLGEPEESYHEREIDPAWMAENYGYNARTECLDFPQLRIGSDVEGEWPISYIALTVASYDNGSWVEKLGGPLTVAIDGDEIGTFETVGEACTMGLCGPAWVIDLTDLEVIVGQEDERFIDFTLEAFVDPSKVDELWEQQKLFIYAEAGHSWTENDGETVTSHFYMAGTSVTLYID